MAAGGGGGMCGMFMLHRIIEKNEENKINPVSNQVPGRVSI